MKYIPKRRLSVLAFLITLFPHLALAQDQVSRPPTKSQIDRMIAKEFGDCDCRKRTIKTVKKGDELQVTVTDDGLHDTSLKAKRTEAVLSLQNGKWTFKKTRETQKCRPGRGHSDFSSEPCT